MDTEVTTWADGFGRWHARVRLPGTGLESLTLDGQMDGLRRKARRAMRRELEERGNGYGPGRRCRIVITDRDTDQDGALTRSITFSEVTD